MTLRELENLGHLGCRIEIDLDRTAYSRRHNHRTEIPFAATLDHFRSGFPQPGVKGPITKQAMISIHR